MKIEKAVAIAVVVGAIYVTWDFFATEKFQNYIDKNSEKPWAHKVQYYLGEINMVIHTSDYSYAEFCYKRMEDKYPKSEYTPEALYKLGMIYEETKRFGLAKVTYKKILEQYPNYENYKRVENRYGLIMNY
ncbi:MAG: hypothetical protein A2474_01785 [Elusimicrobia bacterium RIFOXYC2_FULL_34_12]|nr:MAG: hypothetical protein A2474_01785 [Elusimicrobia bacterium RIFOXYC2_FULL_34_12]OGS39036.1 MAG: hypothetical protein A2551_07385 [Elusimicrobia bacterium RIFOXYD2_FULL_34_30]